MKGYKRKKHKRFCQMCGGLYEGITGQMFCPACGKKRRREQYKEWYHKNVESERKRAKQRAAHKYDQGKIPVFDETSMFADDKKLYCANYDADNLSCIQCYENQTAMYKSCHKRG